MKRLLNILVTSFIVLLLFGCFPQTIKALASDYEDKVSKIVGIETDSDKLSVYIFHRKSCPHCRQELEWMKEYEKENEDIVVYYFEIEGNKHNMQLAKDVIKELGMTSQSVPITVVGDKYFNGYSDAVQSGIIEAIDYYLDKGSNEEEKQIPWLGKVNVKKVSLPLIAIIFGLVDGFNPCAMWILLFLINMLLGMKDKKRQWILGGTFLFVSGLVYFLAMLGLTSFLEAINTNILQKVIAVVALIAGSLNIKNYITSLKKKDGCTVVDASKRKKTFAKIRKFTSEKNFWLALLGIAALAISVNMIELACSLGFPATFTEILAINGVSSAGKIFYLLLYILLYMIDDIIVFVLSMVTLEATGVTNKYSKYTHLVAGIIMILMAVLLIFKPEWLMFNFK